MPPPKPATVDEMLTVATAKLPLPVMFAAVGAWPISSALAGSATAMTPTASRPDMAPAAMSLPSGGAGTPSRGTAFADELGFVHGVALLGEGRRLEPRG
jgi:hypothetical protein